MNEKEAVREAIIYLQSGDYEEASLICNGLANGNFDNESVGRKEE